MFPSHDTDFYTAADRASVFMSALTVAVIGVLALPGLLAFALANVRAARIRAWEARKAEDGGKAATLRPGKVVLTGKVMGAPGTAVVTITIWQSGREYTVKNGRRHKWTEINREVDARPFTLELETGEEVLVEPGKDVFLVDYLGTLERPAAHERTRVAVLRPGETVHVEGRLVAPPRSGPYRAGGTPFTLRAAPGERLLISVEHLQQRHLDRAEFHRKWVIGLTAAIAALHVGLFAPYWAESILGHVEELPVQETHTWTTTNKGHQTPHYGIRVTPSTAAGAILEEVSAHAFTEIYAAKGKREIQVPIIVVPGFVFIGLGERPTLNGFACVLPWFAVLGIIIGYFATARHVRPWYEREKVIDDGEGPLGQPDSLV